MFGFNPGYKKTLQDDIHEKKDEKKIYIKEDVFWRSWLLTYEEFLEIKHGSWSSLEKLNYGIDNKVSV